MGNSSESTQWELSNEYQHPCALDESSLSNGRLKREEVGVTRNRQRLVTSLEAYSHSSGRNTATDLVQW